MKVQELLENIQKENFDLEEALSIKKYLPIDVKKTLAQSIIYECVSDAFGATKIDSVQKYMAYVRYMITTHTDLEYDDEDYDIVCSTEYGDGTLIDAIFDCFERDAEEFEMILDMMVEDYMHELSIEYSVARLINDLSVRIGRFADKAGKLDIQKMIPEGLDVEKINSFLNKYIK